MLNLSGPRPRSKERGDEEEGPEVVVTGPKQPRAWVDGGGGESGGGSGGGAPTPPPPPPNCAKTQAIEAANEIEATDNDQFVEWGSLVFRDKSTGAIKRSPLLGGEGAEIRLNEFNSWLSSNGVSWSDVVGMVHNHPQAKYGGAAEQVAINRYPSTGDWGFADYAVRHGANADDFSLFVNDTKGALREFDYNEKQKFRDLSNDQKVRGASLPDRTSPCGS